MSPTAWILEYPLKALLIGALLFIAIAASIRLWNESREKGALAEAGVTVAEGQMAAGQDAQRVTIDVYNRASEVDATTRSNRDDILAAPGAQDAIPADVADAGRRALCLRAAYRDEPACQQLRNAHP